MIKNKKKLYILSFVFVIIIAVVICFICSPVSAKIDHVTLKAYTDIDSLRSYLKSDEQNFNCFNDEISAENVGDFVNVNYKCKIKNRGLSNMFNIRNIVSNVPDNDDAFLAAHGGDWSTRTWFWGTAGSFTNIIIYRKGLTDEELFEKIKQVEIDITYNKNGVSDSCKVNGIEKIKDKDIKWADY